MTVGASTQDLRSTIPFYSENLEVIISLLLTFPVNFLFSLRLVLEVSQGKLVISEVPQFDCAIDGTTQEHVFRLWVESD
jgi:hypothetical protein